MEKKLSKYVLVVLYLLFVLTGVLFVINDYRISLFMPLSPIIYTICFLIVYRKRRKAFNSVVVVIIYTMFFLRMVIVPVIYVASGYTSVIRTASGVQYLNEAVMLVGFEFICVTLFILSSKKIIDITSYSIVTDIDGDIKIKKYVKTIIVILISIGIICILLDKSVLVIVSTVFNRFTDTEQMNIKNRQMLIEVKEKSSIVFNLFIQVVFYLQILIPAYVISYVTRKRREQKNKGFILGLLVAFFSVMFVTNDNMNSVCIMLACLLVMFSAYEKKMTKVLPIIATIVVVFIFLFLFRKVGYDNGKTSLSDISKVLCAYFAAYPNVSTGFAVQYDDKIATFWGDIVAGIPYMMVFFPGFPKSVALYNIAVHGYSGIVNQIMPLISYGYQYLGIFAPLFTIIVYSMALSLEEKYRKTDKTFNRMLYALMFINFAIGPCIFGFPSTIKRVCYFIPLLLLIKINKDRN